MVNAGRTLDLRCGRSPQDLPSSLDAAQPRMIPDLGDVRSLSTIASMVVDLIICKPSPGSH